MTFQRRYDIIYPTPTLYAPSLKTFLNNGQYVCMRIFLSNFCAYLKTDILQKILFWNLFFGGALIHFFDLRLILLQTDNYLHTVKLSTRCAERYSLNVFCLQSTFQLSIVFLSIGN